MSRYIDADKLTFSRVRIIHPDGTAGGWNAVVMSSVINNAPTADVVEIPKGNIGNLSDGYHTFNELYHHRAILFSVICNSMPDKAWKSKLHDTGDMYDGMFIVGIETPEGQATYHYDIEPYWDLFKVKELEKAPKWDGHTPQEAIDRISKLSVDVAVEFTCVFGQPHKVSDCPITEEIDKAKADTVKKMQEMLKQTYDREHIETGRRFVSLEIVDLVAKAMLEGENGT